MRFDKYFVSETNMLIEATFEDGPVDLLEVLKAAREELAKIPCSSKEEIENWYFNTYNLSSLDELALSYEEARAMGFNGADNDEPSAEEYDEIINGGYDDEELRITVSDTQWSEILETTDRNDLIASVKDQTDAIGSDLEVTKVDGEWTYKVKTIRVEPTTWNSLIDTLDEYRLIPSHVVGDLYL